MRKLNLSQVGSNLHKFTTSVFELLLSSLDWSFLILQATPEYNITIPSS